MAVGKAFFAVLLLAAIAVAQAGVPKASGKPAVKPKTGKGTPVKPKAAPLVAPSLEPAASPQVLRPSQMPAVPPRVSYQNGQLTIVAENSTMADILAQIRLATGVKIETIGGPSGDRVAARIGPAPVRDVILSLVQGSQYDFIILGSMTDPQGVERVILTPKISGGTVAAAPQRPSQPTGNAVYEAPVAETSDDDGNEGFAPAPPPQMQPQATPNDPNAPPKTPEQLLEELRRMEEQRNNPQGRPQRPPRDR